MKNDEEFIDYVISLNVWNNDDEFINYILSLILCTCVSALVMFIGVLVVSPMGTSPVI